MKDLIKLHEKLISEGCNEINFHIRGIGKFYGDAICLGQKGENWEVYYQERSHSGEVFYSSSNKKRVIQYFYNYILKIQHFHVITFTRSKEIFEERKTILESNGIKIHQNDIAHYKHKGDYIYRLFVFNKDIFRAREIFDVVPFYDMDLKR